MEHLTRRTEDVPVKTVGKDGATPLHHAIELLGHADGETLHTAGHGLSIVGFDHEMQVIPLH